MPRVNLTDAFCRSARPVGDALTEFADTKERGLALRVTAAGVKSWTFRYRNAAGEQKRLSLGRLDDVSLAKARAAAVAERGKVHAGDDPAKAKRLERKKAVAASKLETIEEVGLRYFAEAAVGRHRPNARRKRESTLTYELRYFHKHVVPEFGTEKLGDMTRARIQAFINDLADEFAPSTAIQALGILQAIFVFGARQELVAVNPCQFVTAPRFEARERVLTDAELRIIWNGFDNAAANEKVHISRPVALAVMLAAATIQRRAEVTGMRKEEVDRNAKTWTIPGTRTKNHRTHVVPLSDLALDLYDQAVRLSGESECVFPSPRDKGKSIVPSAMTHAWSRLVPTLDFGGPPPKLRPHDLRRTGATNLTSERIGVARFTVSKVLNHSLDTGDSAAVTAVYDRNAYLPEKRRALEAWATLLSEIVDGQGRASNVVRLAR